MHAQFETIHPFADGNGRTGRALVELMSRRSGLATACSPPISSALALSRDAYIGARAPDEEVEDVESRSWLVAVRII